MSPILILGVVIIAALVVRALLEVLDQAGGPADTRARAGRPDTGRHD